MARREKYDTFWLQTQVAAPYWELRTLAQPENALYYIWASHRLTRKSVLHPVLHLGLTPPHTQVGAPSSATFGPHTASHASRCSIHGASEFR